MLKALIKKQFMECFRSYFVNQKTGKARSKAGITGMFIGFGVLILVMLGVFFSLAFLLEGLVDAGMVWLYFALMGIISTAMGTFGSVFNTFSALYQARDNEQLLSMPIPPGKLLLSRMMLVFGLSILYTDMVWIPALIFRWIKGGASPASIVFGLILVILLPMLVTVLTSILGWLVALISSRLKNKSIITVILSLGFFILYYSVCFRMSDLIEGMVQNSDKVGTSLKTWANLFYQLGHAADGEAPAMLLFALITGVLFAACFYILSRTFFRIITRSESTAKKASRAKTVRSAKSPQLALLGRELKRFFSSPAYMLNCGLSAFLLPVLAIAAVVKHESLSNVLTVMSLMLPGYEHWLALVIAGVIGMILSMGAITIPSISLEGKNLWIMRSLPVRTESFFWAKLNLHMLVNLIPAFFAAIVLGILFQLSGLAILAVLVYLVMFIWLLGAFGLILGIAKPNLNWTSETIPIKQNMGVLIIWVAGLVLLALTGGGAYLLRSMSMPLYLLLFSVLLALLAMLCGRILKKWGVAKLEEL